MGDTNAIQAFMNESDAIVRVNELISAGVPEEDIMIIVDRRSEDSILGDKREVRYKEASGSVSTKIVSFFTNEDPEEKVLKNLNLSQAEKDHYADELKAGKVLLYAENAPAAGEEDRSD
ncbi:general stress protein [Terribacillus sp. 7520-G]|uniref:general stress protein n=1 Tax=Terribacillus TaxID=459532 RepID=UPI000BA745EE|nr:general stress protein [Terribacillus sp. 7520-G]PAD37434.1 hypothetical protein CHH53_16180 [Terribacillus sp. 7520-G]